MWNKFLDSRVGLYVIFGLLYLASSKIFGFEGTVVAAFGQILGELTFQNKQNG
jgi:hypothetical protein